VVLRVVAGTQLAWWRLRSRLGGERGATAIEYAIMLAFIAAVIVAAVTLLGQNTQQPFSRVCQDGFGGGSPC
jgi:pilus assembly protein Flp/PilA